MDVMLSGGGGESVLTSMKFAVLPIAKVFTMCFMGFLITSEYVGITTNGRKLLNGVSNCSVRHPCTFLLENAHL